MEDRVRDRNRANHRKRQTGPEVWEFRNAVVVYTG